MYFDFRALLKYLVEGVGVALAAYYIPRRIMNLQEIAMIALTAAATFAMLDQFAPSIAAGARQGSGFGIGYGLVQNAPGLEGFEGEGADYDVMEGGYEGDADDGAEY